MDYGRFDSERELRDYIDANFGSLGTDIYGDGDCDLEVTDECDDLHSGGGDNGAVEYSPIYLTQYKTMGLGDGWFGGDTEVVITVSYTNSSGTPVTGEARYEGLSGTGTYDVPDPGREMLPVSPILDGATFTVRVIEEDLSFDDELGEATFDGETIPDEEFEWDKFELTLNWSGRTEGH